MNLSIPSQALSSDLPIPLFLVGCPRSGTTWLQIVLGGHDNIATVRETHLFDRYLYDIYARYEREAQNPGKDGLRVLFDSSAFDALCRGFSDRVLARIAGTKPDATIVLEKTASQIWVAMRMARLYPAAHFLHIVRDPRAVVASMLAYAREDWANEPGLDAARAAEIWRDAVTIGHREMAALGHRQIELRYEDMQADPNGALHIIWQRLGLTPMPYDPERYSIEAVKRQVQSGTPDQPTWENRPNFFRRGTVDGWYDELSPDQIVTIERICGELMAELGYERAL
jgi:hypothetical protein